MLSRRCTSPLQNKALHLPFLSLQHNVKLSLTYLDLDDDGQPAAGKVGSSGSSQAAQGGSAPRALPAS